MIILGLIILVLLIIFGSSYILDKKEAKHELYINDVKISALRDEELFEIYRDASFDEEYRKEVYKEMKKRYLLEGN